ncbi:hypothetical protein RNJ44_02512 [Nakaseomyces bracarensis]|uniref:Membrane protein PTM1 n=1 Tax=Nakaseomyces bracarensis TaxID=273131 RepID=A0ABR4NM42_9SACH
MKSFQSSRCVLLTLYFLFLQHVAAIDRRISVEFMPNPYVCEGMKAGRNKGDSHISFDMANPSDISEELPVAVAVFNYKDHSVLGDFLYGSSLNLCDKRQVSMGKCTEEQLGHFYTDGPTSYEFLTYFLDGSQDVSDIRYDIEEDGYYCFVVKGYTNDMGGVVHFNNSYGRLPLGRYRMIRAYEWLIALHFVVTGLFASRIWKFRTELLRIHKIILILLGIMTIDTILQWSLHYAMNIAANNATKAYSIFVVLFAATRDIFTLYFLALLSLGQSVVYPELPPEQIKWFKRLLVLLFVFISYGSLTLMITQKANWSLFATVIVTYVYYFKLIRGFKSTIKYLKDNGQTVKLSMYKKLLWIMIGNFLVIVGLMIYQGYHIINYNDIPLLNVDYASIELKTEFTTVLIKFLAYAAVAYLWRPKETSYLLALSRQLPTDQEAVLEFSDNGLLPSDEEEEDQQYKETPKHKG